MQSIYNPTTLHEIISRIDKLTPDSKRQWGKMEVAQMMAHCCTPLEVAVGDTTLHPPFIMKILAPLMKDTIVNEKPYKQGLPTAKEFAVADTRDFKKEKIRLTMLLTRLSNTSKEDMANRKHPFFGKLTPEQWSNANVKHLDHHLRQFGV